MKNVGYIPLNEDTLEGNPKVIEDISKIVSGGNILPKPISYKDIDSAIIEYIDNNWLVDDTKLDIQTYFFTQQRMNEFTKTWEAVDENNNLIPNFKIISRQNNPKKGTLVGDSYNIPTNKWFRMGLMDKIENGKRIYLSYEMKQPFTIDLIYNIKFVTNKLNLLNQMNTRVNKEFKSLQNYANVNGHYMQIKLSNINDESDYDIDERKIYVQDYEIVVASYIIEEDDMRIVEIPSRSIVDVGIAKPNGAFYSDNESDTIKIDVPSGIINTDKIRTYVSEIGADSNTNKYTTIVKFKSNNYYNVSSIKVNGDSSSKVGSVSINNEVINGEIDGENYFTINKFDNVSIEILDRKDIKKNINLVLKYD